VEAHIFIAFLAFLLDRALEKKLKSAGMEFSSKETWQMPKTVQVVAAKKHRKESHSDTSKIAGLCFQ